MLQLYNEPINLTLVQPYIIYSRFIDGHYHLVAKMVAIHISSLISNELPRRIVDGLFSTNIINRSAIVCDGNGELEY